MFFPKTWYAREHRWALSLAGAVSLLFTRVCWGSCPPGPPGECARDCAFRPALIAWRALVLFIAVIIQSPENGVVLYGDEFIVNCVAGSAHAVGAKLIREQQTRSRKVA